MTDDTKRNREQDEENEPIRQQRLPLEWDVEGQRPPRPVIRKTTPTKSDERRQEKKAETESENSASPLGTMPGSAGLSAENAREEQSAEAMNPRQHIAKTPRDTSGEQTEKRQKDVVVPASADVTLGQKLMEGRGACNMSISQVGQSTKIPPTFIETAEADRIEQLPPPVYSRSYIAQLCRLYGMDPQPLLDEYSRLTEAAGRKAAAGPPRKFVLGSESEDGHLKYQPANYQEAEATHLVDRLSKGAVVGSLAVLVLLVLVAFGVQQYRNWRIRRAEDMIQEYAPATPAPAGTTLDELIVPQQLPMKEMDIPGEDAERSGE